jgi:hypothetical protein
LRNPHPLGSFATDESVQSFKVHTVPDFVVPFRAHAAPCHDRSQSQR